MPVDQIPLDELVGPAVVARVPDEVDTITAEVLDGLDISDDADRLLLRTQNSTLWSRYPASFQEDYVALSPDAAQWVVAHSIQCLGVDYLSVQHYDDGPETHQILLEGSVLIIEGLNLSSVPAGWWELFCLPIKIEGAEAALARAALRPLPE
ncbi:arylformamidase [Salinibacter ruber]|nr:arylformamidase [Salinibacter ruber]